MISALNLDNPSEQICALTTRTDDVSRDICLRIRATPLLVEGQRWLVFCAQDITQEVFRANLENVFLHDINKIAQHLSDLAVSWKKTWDHFSKVVAIDSRRNDYLMLKLRLKASV